ncbi:MAG TPA: class I SAM-dependent methyltransferase [Methylocystis sp.]|nr:class I SAM-dependent methyltransferase [Methylocystis sp.]
MTLAENANPFTGALGEEYQTLRLICPNHPLLAEKLGQYVGRWSQGASISGFEIGCGTGISTYPLLSAAPGLSLVALDASTTMLDQARANLSAEVAAGRLRFVEADALQALRALPDESLDLVASNYATHNFRADYRRQALAEVFRALKPGGLFVNGDRFALDDGEAHLALTQATLRRWFATFAKLGRTDILEEWVIHLFSDESPGRIMVFTPALVELGQLGFAPVEIEFRDGVDTLVAANKPRRPPA